MTWSFPTNWSQLLTTSPYIHFNSTWIKLSNDLIISNKLSACHKTISNRKTLSISTKLDCSKNLSLHYVMPPDLQRDQKPKSPPLNTFVQWLPTKHTSLSKGGPSLQKWPKGHISLSECGWEENFFFLIPILDIENYWLQEAGGEEKMAEGDKNQKVSQLYWEEE
jgi:hypothetical protein